MCDIPGHTRLDGTALVACLAAASVVISCSVPSGCSWLPRFRPGECGTPEPAGDWEGCLAQAISAHKL